MLEAGGQSLGGSHARTREISAVGNRGRFPHVRPAGVRLR